MNPFKDAVELLPKLEKQTQHGNDVFVLKAGESKSIITALSACRGLADGSEVIVPKPTER
jgi:hypothetical protein